MGQKIFLDSIYQSMQDSARQVRLSLGRPSSHATRQQALQQVAMLKAAKEALEDMHPANVFVDTVTEKPICIDCIVKFIK